MRTDHESETVRSLTLRVWSELMDDMSRGVVPTDVSSFSELHAYVDANEYGRLHELPLRPDGSYPYELVDRVQSLVSELLSYETLPSLSGVSEATYAPGRPDSARLYLWSRDEIGRQGWTELLTSLSGVRSLDTMADELSEDGYYVRVCVRTRGEVPMMFEYRKEGRARTWAV